MQMASEQPFLFQCADDQVSRSTISLYSNPIAFFERGMVTIRGVDVVVFFFRLDASLLFLYIFLRIPLHFFPLPFAIRSQ